MFEQTLNELVATVCIDLKAKNVLDHNGFEFDLAHGWNKLDYTNAVRLVEKMYRMAPSVPKSERKVFISTINMIIFAFGPEFEQEHRKPEVVA